jgi:hypothetical protein
VARLKLQGSFGGIALESLMRLLHWVDCKLENREYLHCCDYANYYMDRSLVYSTTADNRTQINIKTLTRDSG